MFKIFQGFHLVEEHQQAKKENSHTRWQFFVSMIKTNLNITTNASPLKVSLFSFHAKKRLLSLLYI